jgi:uncharacterized membrane protein YbhN (UPF0104 family)
MMRLSPKVWFVIRLVFSFALLWLAFRHIDWSVLWASSQNLQLGWLVLALLLISMANLLAAGRWGFIMQRTGLSNPWQRYITLYFAGGLINQGLPSTLGGDSYRALQGSRQQTIGASPAIRYGVFAVFLDRGMGLLGNTLLGAIGLVMAGATVSTWASPIGLLVFLGLVGGVLIVGFLFKVPGFLNLVQKLLNATRLPLGMNGLKSVLDWPINVAQVSASITVHLLTLATFGACLRAYGVTVPFEALLIGIPALGLLMMLPISISGWGLRETTLSAFLSLWGIPVSTTLLASITYGLIILLVYLPATSVLVKKRPKR